MDILLEIVFNKLVPFFAGLFVCPQINQSYYYSGATNEILILLSSELKC